MQFLHTLMFILSNSIQFILPWIVRITFENKYDERIKYFIIMLPSKSHLFIVVGLLTV